MTHGITLEELQSEARWNGFRLSQEGTSVTCVHLQQPDLTNTFSLEPNPTVSRLLTRFYGSIQAYYWMQGYNVSEQEGLLTISWGNHHPAFDRHIPVTTSFHSCDFRDPDDLIWELSKWVAKVGTLLEQRPNPRKRLGIHRKEV